MKVSKVWISIFIITKYYSFIWWLQSRRVPKFLYNEHCVKFWGQDRIDARKYGWLRRQFEFIDLWHAAMFRWNSLDQTAAFFFLKRTRFSALSQLTVASFHALDSVLYTSSPHGWLYLATKWNGESIFHISTVCNAKIRLYYDWVAPRTINKINK